jgi:hypothetical protein
MSEPTRYRLHPELGAAHVTIEREWPDGRVTVAVCALPACELRVDRRWLTPIEPPRPPGDVVDSGRLLETLDERRVLLAISWRDVCRQAGLKADSTITRLKQGHMPDVQNLARLLLWLGDTDLKSILREAPDAA